LDGSGGEHKDLKIILGNGEEEAKDGQGNALKIKTYNHVRIGMIIFSPKKLFREMKSAAI
jgi:hypothetical protein